jgi:16S rRNA (guanine527-N7)-methyltransferase
MSGRSEFEDAFDVSRETLERLEIYVDLLSRWNQKINLVSPQTISDAWMRHIADSAQLSGLIHNPEIPIADLGSGAGFPGLVVSLITGAHVSLIESDQRKCAFLNTVIRETEANARTINNRISEEHFGDSGIVTARALAPLDKLLEFAKMGQDVEECLFLKGKSLDTEIETARKRWHFEYDLIQSKTDEASRIIKIGAFDRVSET